MQGGIRTNYQLSGYEYMNDLNILSFTSSVKDFNIIPITNGEPTNLVKKCIINDISNTVFLPYSQTYGSTFDLNVDSRNGSIKDSTFVTLPEMLNTGSINKISVIDYITLNNYSNILNSIILSYGSYTNKSSEIVNTTFGGGYGYLTTPFNDISLSNCVIYNCVIGGSRNNNMSIQNLSANKSLICFNGSTLLSIEGKVYLTAIKNQSTSSFSSNIKLNTYTDLNPNKSLYGYLYDFNLALDDMELNNNTVNRRLVNQYLDNSNNIISVTVSVAQ